MPVSDIFTKALRRRDDLDESAAKAKALEAAAAFSALDRANTDQSMLSFYKSAFTAVHLAPIQQASQGLLEVRERNNNTVTLGTPDAFKTLEASEKMIKSDGRDLCDAIEFYFSTSAYGAPHLAIQPLTPSGMMRGEEVGIADTKKIEQHLALFLGEVFDRPTLEQLNTPAP